MKLQKDFIDLFSNQTCISVKIPSKRGFYKLQSDYGSYTMVWTETKTYVLCTVVSLNKGHLTHGFLEFN